MFRNFGRSPVRVLIASNHALFRHGLVSLFKKRLGVRVEIVGEVTNLESAVAALEERNVDLVIVDYDDEQLNREDFLAHFVSGGGQKRVILLSLSNPESAMLYDRREVPLSQLEAWFEGWRESDTQSTSPSVERAGEKIQTRSNRMKHLIVASILVIVLTVLIVLGAGQVRLLPVAASAQAQPIDSLFRLMFLAIAFLFSLIVVFMLYSIVVFRRRKGDETDARHIEGNNTLEVTWTAIPLVVVLGLSFLGAQSLAQVERPDPKPLEVDVIGLQWTWRFEYPRYGIVSNELVLPVNKQAILYLSSQDVIHSFWVPEFRVKQDLLPGGEEFVRTLRITPTQIGSYKVRCAELCGIRHAYMESPVIVVSQADFDVWVAQQTGEPTDPVERGRKWANQYGCLSCHSLDGSKLVGPTWLGLFGSEVKLADGRTVIADESYIIESIRNPGAAIVEGYPNIMPASLGQDLSDERIQDIIAFIKTLR
ncbi:MAG: cytochrome c oxidase subunit II [Anaerolineales bacterium]|nr:cytochrome c oxidase subunit II [Anaerolineales bacterium]MDW8446304.1 cytochrome c oxidase subunit II [Anaerolineales bacterium]